MNPSTNQNTPLTPRDLIVRAAGGDPYSVSAVRKNLDSILVNNALRDFLRPHVTGAVRQFWSGRRSEVRKHVTFDECVEDVISNVLMAIHKNPSLLTDGKLAGYAWTSARNYVFDIERWEKRRRDALGSRKSLTVAELRSAVMVDYVEQREEAKLALKRMARLLSPTQLRAIIADIRARPQAVKDSGLTPGQMSHARRVARKAVTRDSNNAG